MSLPYLNIQADKPVSAVLIFEGALAYSRKSVTIRGGDGADRVLKMGAVLGFALFGAVTITPDAGNTGDGALGGVTLGDAAKVGDYELTCIAASVDGGIFQVLDPDGYRLGDAEVGVAFSSRHVNFTVADGAADFVVGDVITVTVAEGDGKAVNLDPSATDGTQLAGGVLLDNVTAPAGVDVDSTAIVRFGLVAADGLVWQDAVTAEQKAAALARLGHDGLHTRTSA
ncbi:MAG: head decoration protein [Alphaproteobacteria bacterium]|nr:head decoration protein [Alphaproteobacteria bacterium]